MAIKNPTKIVELYGGPLDGMQIEIQMPMVPSIQIPLPPSIPADGASFILAPVLRRARYIQRNGFAGFHYEETTR